MLRSEINKIIKEGVKFLEDKHFSLPAFARWTPKMWRQKGAECGEIVERLLGWDVTDFGSEDFEKTGLLLFTLRNGMAESIKHKGKNYAEKIMIVRENQITPTHFHYQKTEDIINRGSGELVIQFWNSTKDEKLATGDVAVNVDGVRTVIPAGGTITLKPGQSVCIPQRLYHKFWGKKGKGAVLVGEVSSVNDDYADNRFYEPIGRFAEIQNDEPPLYLLCSDYKDYYKRHKSSFQSRESNRAVFLKSEPGA
jgi:D-lyxose ketol-isomerase